jgi:hypothetical protein
MRRLALLGIVVSCLAAAAACGQSGDSGAGSGGSGAAGSTATGTGGTGSGVTGSGGGTTSVTSSGATGGATSSSASSGATGGGGATSSSSGSGGGMGAADHVVISEVAIAPGTAEFIELYNPTASAVDLSQYFLSDNAVYHKIAAGQPWAPMETPGTDFLVQFPAGTSIAPGAVIVIAANKLFTAEYPNAKCPEFILDTVPLVCANGTAQPMVVPANGGLDPTKQGMLISDTREMVILFQWDGAAAIVKDVDYVTWGATFDAGATRVDKTGVAGYVADTAAAMQKPAAAPAGGVKSIERCSLEGGETLAGGNGLTGHDETSEPMDTNFVGQSTPTPGVKNACLP